MGHFSFKKAEENDSIPLNLTNVAILYDQKCLIPSVIGYWQAMVETVKYMKWHFAILDLAILLGNAKKMLFVLVLKIKL